jgi:hypothetical protein
VSRIDAAIKDAASEIGFVAEVTISNINLVARIISLVSFDLQDQCSW